jgi:hypothetical protein
MRFYVDISSSDRPVSQRHGMDIASLKTGSYLFQSQLLKAGLGDAQYDLKRSNVSIIKTIKFSLNHTNIKCKFLFLEIM